MSRTRRLAVVLTVLATWPCAGCAAQYGPVRDASRGSASVPQEAPPDDRPSRDSPSTATGEGSGTQRPSPSSVTPQEETSARGEGRALRVAGWVSLGVGAEAAILAAVTSVMFLHEKSVRDDDCDAHRACSAAGLGANATIESLVAVNTVSWIVTAAGLGAGTLLLLTHPPDKRATATAITLSPTGSGLALGVRSSF
jgi:hypothetical protein